MEDFWQGDGIHGRLPVLLWQIHHAWPERHLKFITCIIINAYCKFRSIFWLCRFCRFINFCLNLSILALLFTTNHITYMDQPAGLL